ncbi:FAD-dependent oxidoreductase [Streptomyces atratus]|uniref:FAD-dependent oxidoreductase n=1 Tax=Streptomyces TaxID=1883 RepID=UPI00379D1DA8
MAPSLGQGGNQAVEDAIVLAHHVTPGRHLGAGLAAYTADRLPRTSAIVRKAVHASRLMCLTSAPAVALRDALMSTVSRLGPTLVLRTFEASLTGSRRSTRMLPRRRMRTGHRGRHRLEEPDRAPPVGEHRAGRR